MFTMEITRLIERCRQGDADALGELYKAYAQRMRGVCRRYISDEQTVEDVLHDAFVIIFTSSAPSNSQPPTPGLLPKNPSKSAHRRASTVSLRWKN